jgi:hypothetical protein
VLGDEIKGTACNIVRILMVMKCLVFAAYDNVQLWAGQSGDRFPVGRNFPQPSRLGLGPTQAPIQWVPGLSLGVKRPGSGVDNPLHLAPRLRNEKSYTSTPTVDLRGLFLDEFTFTFIIT